MKLFTETLTNARVHIGGAGRVGTSIALALHAAGIGHISCNDPQMLDEEQLGCCVFSRRSDVGRPKVHVLERFLDGRPGLVFEPIVAPNESAKLRSYLKRADLIICCANQLEARLVFERAAIRLGKPSIQASVQDGRQSLGGVVSAWVPDTGCSCFGCLFSEHRPVQKRGELLLATVTQVVGNLAAHFAVDMLAGNGRDILMRHNLFAIDVGGYSIQPLQVLRRPGCEICSTQRSSKRNST